ncbi:MAG: serine hydrolase domain-containing protein [Geminicoccaceae bacterium]
MGAAAFPVDRVTAREAPGPAAAISPSELVQMRLLATGFMTRWGVPGMQVAIARADAIAYNAAFGLADAAKATPLTTANLFRIASLSKPITSVAIYKLIEAGKLTLGSRVFGPGALLGTRYGSKPYPAALRSVTVAHLLTHTAGGWPNDAADPMFLFPSMTIQDLISWTLDNRPLTNVPGTSYAYSNFGYAVLGRVIETLSGKGYGSYVTSTVLKPCGISAMKLAGNTLADRLPGEVRYKGQFGENPYNMNVRRMDAHGGWTASAADLVRFLVRVDNFPQAKDILKAASLASMTLPTSANPNYAKGWEVNVFNNWWHSGSLPGTTTFMARISSNFCWAALTNSRVPGSNMNLELDQLMWTIASVPASWGL